MDLASSLIWINFASTLFMVGLIWFVQVVHYPLFGEVGSETFVEYQKWHQRLTTFVVGPPMLIEAITSVLLVYFIPPATPVWMIYSGLGLVFLIWISTAAIQVPCHSKLETKFDPNVHRRLVNSNWIRTIAWSLRGVIVCVMINQAMINS